LHEGIIYRFVGFRWRSTQPTSCVDTHREQQQIAKTPLTAQQVLDLSDLFSVADRFNEIHGLKVIPVKVW